MWRALRVLLRKEFLQIRRDTVILRMLFIMPMIQLLVLSNVATFEVKTAQLWVVDQDHTPAARALADRFTASGRFAVAGWSVVAAPGEDALLSGAATAMLVIPPGFARDVVRDRHAVLQLVLNAENGSQAGVTQAYAAEIISRHARELGGETWQPARRGGVVHGAGDAAPVRGRPVIEVRTRSRYNPSLDYRRFMVPGILVQLITLIGTLMTALNIVREKEAGTLDQLNVTPVRPAVFIAAKLLPLWVIGLVEFAVGVLVAAVVFRVPMEGSLPLLFLGAGVFLLAALGVGLWVSTVSDTQQQALFVTFSLMMVYILMSGLFTPVRAMPSWVQVVAQLNPMMHFIAMVRAVLLKGAGIADVWRQLLALALLGTGILALAVAQYRKRAA
ncbi:MAG: ABC transporter permease [Gemmatimonadaceae bacterium]|nr:ABC transporter permease [Gemmatimonadaceae bacterium]